MDESSYDFNVSSLENVFIGISGMIGARATTTTATTTAAAAAAAATFVPRATVAHERDTCPPGQTGGPLPGVPAVAGAGKSTLAKALAEKLGLPVYYEPVVDNVYLADFYGDMAKYAFQLQVTVCS
jgi:deoxyadenosine/deoxycytidine kinase